MKFLSTVILSLTFQLSFAQQNGFEFGRITYKQFEQTAPKQDSTARAVVLNEFGEAYLIRNVDGHSLNFEHHYIIKILTQEGVSEANISILLNKYEDRIEKLNSVKASSFNIENNRINESELDSKNIFTENTHKYYDHKKFTIPNVRVGSIIEISYTVETPFFTRNFHPWEFQSHLPKLVSEYWATIPGNYNYNISWKGFLELTKNESELVSNCFYAGGGAGESDCARYKFGMKNIPAFIEEDYMTAKSNFLASINFELKELRYPNGNVDKVTNEWKDADNEMKKDPYFGIQLKKGREISQKIESLITSVTDSLEKATIIYNYIKTTYTWNEYYGKYSSDGIKKAFDNKIGNIGDINLSLIAAMRTNGFDVDPLILSTRENGLPTELYPVLSDFNYVIAKLNLGGKVYLLDASDVFLPFGMLPERCLNGKGRVFPDSKPSYWYDLKPTEKNKGLILFDLTLQPTGVFRGTIQQNYYGYRAYKKRKDFYSFGTPEEYLEELKKQYSHMTIKKHEISGTDDVSNIITEKFEVEIEGYDDLNHETILLNPFFLGRIKENPFHSNERFFPVDYGVPLESSINITLSYPGTISLESVPDKVMLSLPNSGGRFLFDVTKMENKLSVNYSFRINKTIFNSEEYHYLKELYARIIQTQNTDFVFKKKK